MLQERILSLNNRIVIVGGGASGIALLANIVEKFIAANVSGWEIIVVDKNKKIGPGLAYGASCDCNLLNTPAGTMGIYADRPQHFLDWLRENPKKWEEEFSYLTIGPFSTPPRRLYGIYLKEMALEIQVRAHHHGLNSQFIQDYVVDIDLNEEEGIVHLKQLPPLRAQFILFALGGFESSSFSHLHGKLGYFNSPYPENRILEEIPKYSPVSVIGSRLSAIDAILTLKSNGHQGHITCVSRQGMLPFVQGGHKDYCRKYLTREHFERLVASRNGKLGLMTILRFVAKEIALAEGKPFRWTTLPHTRCTAAQMLRYEICQVGKQSIRPWQTVLHAVNDILSFTWEILSDEDREKVCNGLLGVFLTYRAAMPLENAEKIYRLIKRGELSILSGLQSVDYDEEQKCFCVVTKGSRGEQTRANTQFVINATGQSADVLKTNDPLIRCLVNKRIFIPHRFGGIQMCPHSLRLIHTDGERHPNVFILGSLACGVHLVTNLLEYIVRVANNVASIISEKIAIRQMQNP